MNRDNGQRKECIGKRKEKRGLWEMERGNQEDIRKKKVKESQNEERKERKD